MYFLLSVTSSFSQYLESELKISKFLRKSVEVQQQDISYLDRGV